VKPLADDLVEQYWEEALLGRDGDVRLDTLSRDHKLVRRELAGPRAAERRRIARLIQDAASAATLMPTRDALLALREQVLALEDAP
jgi:hypothetical protein